jgi:hypothetical protein
LVFGRKRCLAFRFLDRPIATYVVASLLMGGVVLPVASLLASPVLSAVAGMAAGVAAYAATLLVAGDPLAREIALTLWGAVRRLR